MRHLREFFRAFFLISGIFFAQYTWAQSPKAQLKGFVYDEKNGEPLLFATVSLQGTSLGSATDVNGYFSLVKIPAGSYRVRVALLGYDTLFQEISLKDGDVKTLRFRLKETPKELQEVTIKSDRNKATREGAVNIGVNRVTPKEIKSLPSIGGEPDLAQYLQVLPGVTFTGDQGGQLYIRGGTIAQNLTLLDGMVVYNPFHSIGLYSVFETDLIKSADIYTAGFGVEYGGRSSSVMDIRTIDGNKNRLSGKLGVNPFSSRLLLEGPITMDETGAGITYVVSGRTSYLDQTSKALYSYAAQNGQDGIPFAFTDLFGKGTFHFGSGSKLSLAGFRFDDRAKISQRTDFRWNAYGGGLNLLMVPTNAPAIINLTAGYSKYEIDITEETSQPRNSAITSLNTSLDVSYLLNEDEMKYGINLLVNNPGFTSFTPNGVRQTAVSDNTEIGAYYRYKFKVGSFIFDPGFRAHYYSSLAIFSPEPRLGAKWLINESLRLKGSVGRYSQNLISTQSQRDVVTLFNGFVADPQAVVDANNRRVDEQIQKATHYAAGFEWDITENLLLNVEPYYKDFNTLIAVNYSKTSDSDPDFVLETGTARGVDLQVKWDYKDYFVQIGYSLSEANRTFGDQTYPTVFDRRHNLNIIGTYDFGKAKQWEFDFRWNLGSGFPFTQTIGFYENLSFSNGVTTNPNIANGSLTAYYGGLENFNRGRLPWYHRMDISLKRKWKWGERTKLEGVLSATNVYSRENIFYFDRISQRRVNQFPILPSVGFNLEF